MSKKNQDKLRFIDEELNNRRDEDRFRLMTTLQPHNGAKVSIAGQNLLNFCSNDYLALSKHPSVIQKSCEYARKYGAGSTASRLVAGTYTIHQQLEEDIARTFRKDAALLFNSGFQANSTILSTLTNRHSLILADKMSHYSLLQGALAGRADFRRYKHNDLDDLETLLGQAKQKAYKRILIVTETVFSMDGDRTDIEGVAQLANRYEALLFVDDAHAVGVWGKDGKGLGWQVPGVDLLLGTCGKALGSFGAYVACSREMKEYLVNFCPGFIYTTSPAPAVVGAIEASIDLLPGLNELRKGYHEQISYLRSELEQLGLDTGTSTTQIIPIIIGDDSETLQLSQWLEEQGILATAIRPPTVAENSARLRLTVTANHSREDIDYLVEKLKEWKDG